MTILAQKLLLTAVFLFIFLHEIKATEVFQGTCPDGSWKKYLSSKCFKLIDTAAGWNAGSASCQALQPQFKSRIAYLKTKEEQNFVNNYLFKELSTLSTSVWIGAKRDGGNNWAWDDGESVSAEDWEVGYPSADRLNGCVQIDHNSDVDSGTWQDAKCVESRFVLCEAQQELTLSDVVQMLLQAQSDLIKVKQSYDVLDRKHTELQQEFRGLQDEYDELSNKVDGNLDYLMVRDAELEDRLVAEVVAQTYRDMDQDTKLGDLAAVDIILQQQIDALGSVPADLATTLAQLRAKDTNHDTMLADLAAKEVDLQSQIDRLGSVPADLDTTLTNLQNKDTQHDTKIGELVTKDGELQAAIDLLGSVPADLATTLTNLKNKDTAHDVKLVDLEASDLELLRQIAALGAVPDDLVDVLTSLQDKDVAQDAKFVDLVYKDFELLDKINSLEYPTPPIDSVYITYKSQDPSPEILYPGTTWKESYCVDSLPSLRCWVRRS